MLSPLESCRAARDEAWALAAEALGELHPFIGTNRALGVVVAKLDGALHELELLHRREAHLLAHGSEPPPVSPSPDLPVSPSGFPTPEKAAI